MHYDCFFVMVFVRNVFFCKKTPLSETTASGVVFWWMGVAGEWHLSG